MAYYFGTSSSRRLLTCCNDIQTFVNRAIVSSPIDFSVVDGQRNAVEQEEAFMTGASKAHYGESPHNVEPKSLAVDLVPWVDGASDYSDEAFEILEDHLREIEAELIKEGAIFCTFDWGGDWPGAWDRPHWQITGWRKRYKETGR